jgi:hypothetical protein
MARAKKVRVRTQRIERAPPDRLRAKAATRAATIVGIGALFAVVLGSWLPEPRLSISPRGALSDHEIDTPFSVTNDSLWTVHEVRPKCVLKHLVVPGDIVLDAERLEVGAVTPILRRGEETSIVCRGASIRLPIVGAEVSISVHFKTWAPPWNHELTERFGAARDKAGRLTWSVLASTR